MSKLSTAVLKLPDFRRLWLTRSFALMALQAQAVIIGWQVYSLTHNPFMLGITGLVEAIPAIGCALFAGHIVDHARPFKIWRRCMGIMTLNSFALFLFAGGIIKLPGNHLLMILYVAVFISGLARAFIMPSSFSLLAQIVPRHQMSAASAWLSTGFEIGTIGGPAIAGLLYAWRGAGDAWLMPFILLACSFLVFSGMTKKIRQHKNNVEREPALKSIAAGWRFIFQNPALLSAMMLDMFAVLFGGAVAMLPAYADQVLHVGAQGLGFLRAAPSVGAITMALFLALRPFKTIRATTLIWVVMLFGCAIIGFGLSTTFWLSAFFLAMSGAVDAVSVVIRTTIVQLLTTDAFRGRVSSVNSMFIISSNEIGAFESGTAARLLGLVPSVVFGGAMCIMVAAATALLSPKFRKTVIKADAPVL